MFSAFRYKQTIHYLAPLLATLLLNACAGKNWFSYTGWEAKSNNRAALRDGGPYSSLWQTLDIGLHYRYEKEGERLDIEGQVVPQKRIKHFSDFTIWVSIHFLDGDGIILDTHRLWSQRGSTVYWGFRWHFKQSWNLPPGTQALAFSYHGRAGDQEQLWDFWYLP